VSTLLNAPPFRRTLHQHSPWLLRGSVKDTREDVKGDHQNVHSASNNPMTSSQAVPKANENAPNRAGCYCFVGDSTDLPRITSPLPLRVRLG
jgi:hypothetical protein